jgi:hypothetical protein
MTIYVQIYRRRPPLVEDVGYYDEGVTRTASRYVELEKEVNYIYPTRLVPPAVNTRIVGPPKSTSEVDASQHPGSSSSSIAVALSNNDTMPGKPVESGGVFVGSSSGGESGNKTETAPAVAKVTLVPHSSFLYAMPSVYMTSMGGLLRSRSNSTTASMDIPQSSKKDKKCKMSFPIQRRAISGALSTREMDIYALSDSEDERVEMTKFHGGYITDKPNPIKANEQSKLKYVVRV